MSNGEKHTMFSRSLPVRQTNSRPARPRRIALSLFVLILFAVGRSALAQSRFTGRVVGVEAGDRIIARLDTWNVTIQLHGITCPTQPADVAEHAREYTTRRVMNSKVQVEVRGTGPHEMVYGEVRTYDDKSLNAELVRIGLASWAKTYAPNRIDIERVEAQAKTANRGIWGAADGLDVPLPPTPPPPSTKKAANETPKPTTKPTPQQTAVVPSSWASPSTDSAIVPPAASPTPIEHPSVVSAPDLKSSLSALRSRGSRLQKRAEVSPHRDSFLNSLCGAIAAAALISFVAQIVLAGGFGSRRIFFQITVSVGVAAATALLTPLPYLLASHMFRFGTGSLLSIFTPPLIAFCTWASVALCRREQILRAAPAVPIRDLPEHLSDLELVKAKGTVSSLSGVRPFVSQVGRIPAVYLKEVTYSYDAVQSETYYSPRKKGGRRNTRYVWAVIHKETSQADFMLSDGEDRTVLVDGDRANYMPQRVARFYNGVPVETWFTRPYPGDTRTQIEFIGIDSPVVVWGRVRVTMSSARDAPVLTLTSAPYQAALVVEADEARIWTRRPLLGLLLILIALGLTLFLIYALSTPGALGSR